MARTLASKAAGIDLLDRLYCNQIFVYLVLGPEERGWLQSLAKRVQAAIAERGAIGLRAERLQHWALCMLEIFLADELEDLAKRIPFDAPPLPVGLTPKIAADVHAHRRKYFAAFALTVSNCLESSEDEYVALEVASELTDEFRSAPPAVRHRLVERVLAIEFPDAPIDVFAWLADMGVVPSAKFREGTAAALRLGAVAVRAASICEFETLRSYIAGGMRLGHGGRGWAEVLLAQSEHKLSNEVKDRLLAVMQAEERRHNSTALSNRSVVLTDSRWMDKEYISSFLTSCHSMAPYIRAALQKQSTALSNIAAAMISMRKANGDSGKALYAEEGAQDTIAHDISADLRQRGFKVNARSIYRHFCESHRAHVANRRGYFALLQRLDIALPAEYGDMFHYYQVGLELALQEAPAGVKKKRSSSTRLADVDVATNKGSDAFHPWPPSP